MNDSMRELVQVVNRLSDACVRSQVALGLSLPQICVIGGQSVGKSSVLESIVGRDFLPRGHGVVTRCPLILQCKQSEKEYAEFLHDPGHIFTDFTEVRREIEVQTQRLCGLNKGISNKPITVTIYSPHVLDLTLVDLPGITRVAVGDQPPDIERQTLDLVFKYVENPNVIILAVSAANVDLANSDAMKVVREVDPHGKRSIGVITKLDIMDPGTHCRDILINTVFRLKLGYIGVVNRSQEDINNEVSVEEVRQKEASFFQRHEAYQDLEDRMGIPYLQKILNRELTQHIERTLPDMMTLLKTKKRNAEEELGRLQETVQPENVLDRSLYDFSQQIQTEIKGTPGHVQMTEIAGGARIKSLFYKEFAEKLDLSNFILSEEDFQTKIETTIRNLHAIHNGVFIPDQAFNSITSAIIEQYSVPVTQCVDMAGELLRAITRKSAEMLEEYPRLHEAVQFLVESHIQKQEEITKQHLLVHVSAEGSFKNTKHHDYLNNVVRQTLPALASPNEQGAPKRDAFKGRLVLKHKGKEESIWLVITPDTLKCFKNEQEDEDICLLHIDSKVRQRRENGGKERRLVIARTDGKGVNGDSKSLEFVFKDDGTLEKWARCLETNGILPDGDDSEFMMLDPRSDGPGASSSRAPSRSTAAPPNPRLQAARKELLTKDIPGDNEIETVKQMVRSYLMVVSKTIMDLVPKYVVFLLVENTEKFTTRDLSSRIRTEYNVKSLLERDEEVQQRIEQLMREYATSEDALRILKDYYTYARSTDF